MEAYLGLCLLFLVTFLEFLPRQVAQYYLFLLYHSWCEVNSFIFTPHLVFLAAASILF